MADTVSFYFHIHQPVRLRKFSIYHDGQRSMKKAYFDDGLNKEIFSRVAKKCYLPATKAIFENLVEYDGAYRMAFSITGVWVEYAKRYAPGLLDLLRAMVDTGAVTLLGETYYHSLSGLSEDKTEFIEQVKAHSDLMEEQFGMKPQVFRNTEAIYDNSIAEAVHKMGFKGMITEGAEDILKGRSPNYLYTDKTGKLPVILRNFKLSDDIAFRFSARSWDGWPLTAAKFAKWVKSTPGDLVPIYVDFETFGEHQWPETGIHKFLDELPGELLKKDVEFRNPHSSIEKFETKGELDVPFAISWADESRDVTTWLGNPLQQQCFNELRDMEGIIKEQEDEELLHVWRMLQTSDHLYYLSTKTQADGEVHRYFSPYGSPYDAFVNYINIIRDIKHRAMGEQEEGTFKL